MVSSCHHQRYICPIFVFFAQTSWVSALFYLPSLFSIVHMVDGDEKGWPELVVRFLSGCDSKQLFLVECGVWLDISLSLSWDRGNKKPTLEAFFVQHDFNFHNSLDRAHSHQSTDTVHLSSSFLAHMKGDWRSIHSKTETNLWLGQTLAISVKHWQAPMPFPFVAFGVPMTHLLRTWSSLGRLQ